MSNFNLIVKLCLQLAVILLTCRVVSYIGKKYFMQTSVVSEMIAGVILGPSILGLITPNLQQWLFPTHTLQLANGNIIPNPSMSILFALSQIGIILYMFFVGLKLNIHTLQKNINQASILIIVGIVFPFILGVAYVPFIFYQGYFFQAGINMTAAMLYLGTALAITAFPVLARILHESGAAHTKLGTLVLSSGAMIDAIAWCLLAIILAMVRKNHYIAIFTILGGIIYVALMLTAGRSGLKKIALPIQTGHDLTVPTLTIILSMVMLCAWITDIIGIYAIFGAFIAGIAIPRGQFADQVGRSIEYLTTAFLIPTFFVFSGLNTQIMLLNSWELVAITSMIILLAIVGKGIGCTLAAKLLGENWRDSLAVGALMNSRGLMELIIVNIGLEYHIITPTLFTILVVMTIVTTVMASPIYYFLNSSSTPSFQTISNDLSKQ